MRRCETLWAGCCWTEARSGRAPTPPSFGSLRTGCSRRVSPRNRGTVPVAVIGDLKFRAVSAGGSFTCGLTVDSVAYCWGYNRRGQLGTGDSVSSSTALAVGGGLKFATISAAQGGDFFAELHTCGVA